MGTSFSGDGESASSFRLKRPVATLQGFVPGVDPVVETHLDELEKLLSKRIFRPSDTEDQSGFSTSGSSPKPQSGTTAATVPPAPTAAAASTGTTSSASASGGSSGGSTKGRSSGGGGGGGGGAPRITALLDRELTPRRVDLAQNVGRWQNNSLADKFSDQNENEDELTLGEIIDRTPRLAQLKYAFDDFLAERDLDFNTRAILSPTYPGIRNYLVARAFFVMGLRDVNSLRNFVLNNGKGITDLASYAKVSAARTFVKEERLRVPNINDDQSPVVLLIEATPLVLSTSSFAVEVKALVEDYVFNKQWSDLIDSADVGTLPAGIKPQLIRYLKTSPVPIDEDNVNLFLPLFITQIMGSTGVEDEVVISPDESDRDFDVQFLSTERSGVQVSRSAVKCAAQLFYTMVLGDELRVFDAMDHFTHQYLIRESFAIEDPRLREDLRLYVFSEKFTVTDPRTRRIETHDRTQQAERAMFYRQVFGYGGGPLTDDLVVNTEFPHLWKVLMLESAKYLERAQLSPHPMAFVSRQNVMQAVEDLQYNLSLHCTGMATVMTPLVYDELDFITRRIFTHPEVLRHVGRGGGSVWEVVEELHLGMSRSRPRATVLDNKARLGHNILRAIAAYEPADFEEDAPFSAFISNVEAFITTQSIIQESLTDALRSRPDDDWSPGGDGYPSGGDATTTVPDLGGTPSADEWDF